MAVSPGLGSKFDAKKELGTVPLGNDPSGGSELLLNGASQH
jgi:hypothetical protein